jgi:ketosteroid isomerase-like protein
MRALLAVAVLMSLAACQTAPPAGLTDADRAAINQIAADYTASNLTGDWAALGGLWTENAVYLGPEVPAIRGPDAIVADFQSYPRPSEMEVNISASDGSGNWAWARGTWHYVSAATEETPGVTMDGSVLWVLEKQPDGTWLIDTECYNLDAPVEMPSEG